MKVCNHHTEKNLLKANAVLNKTGNNESIYMHIRFDGASFDLMMRCAVFFFYFNDWTKKKKKHDE